MASKSSQRVVSFAGLSRQIRDESMSFSNSTVELFNNRNRIKPVGSFTERDISEKGSVTDLRPEQFWTAGRPMRTENFPEFKVQP
jgi:hypothetical protein